MRLAKKIGLVVMAIVLFLLPLTQQLQAGNSWQVDLSSRYIWRGFDLNPQNKPVIQPSFTHTFGESGFAVNLWGSISFEDKALNEIDLTLTYDLKTTEDYSISLGFIHYGWYFSEDFDFGDHTTQEVYISAGLPKVFLNPNLTFYYDFNNGDGYYVLASLGHSLEVAPKVNLDLSASLGYNGKQWIDRTGFSDLNLGLAIPLVLEKITITPFLRATFILMDEINPFVHNEITLGISIIH